MVEARSVSVETFLNGRVVLRPGCMLEVLAGLPANSVDSVLCDPPYHLQSIVKRFAVTGRTESTRTTSGPHQRTANGFMGKQWDGGDIAFQPATWAAVLRVLKPGGYILAFSSSRTFGRMSVAMEDAGFITHPMIGWIFGSGFPKATRLKAPGYEGHRYGTQSLKPALEPIYMGQKPFSEPTGTANVLRWGTGAVNIDACRVGAEERSYTPKGTSHNAGMIRVPLHRQGRAGDEVTVQGRWPANLITDGSDEVIAAFPEAPGQQRAVGPQHGAKPSINVYGDFGARDLCEARGDSGSAARFFYAAKADEDERAGSSHPTVKPQSLLRYGARLITPAGGTILDCFAGTGTTGEAAYHEGFSAILIEREPEYQADIRRRMALILAGRDERKRAITKAKGKPDDLTGTLFGSLAISDAAR